MTLPHNNHADLHIYSWSEIAQSFNESDILLGNGFSRSLSDKFNYDSLFEEFIKGCGDDEPIFRAFNTTNFELIQEQLINAQKVNKIFNILNEGIDPAISQLREGLIKAVRNNHPKPQEIDSDRLDRLSADFDQFSDIYTTNYDLHLYLIIMRIMDRHNRDKKTRPYNDYYWDKIGQDYLGFKSYQDIKKIQTRILLTRSTLLISCVIVRQSI